jgi:hypothetical protein
MEALAGELIVCKSEFSMSIRTLLVSVSLFVIKIDSALGIAIVALGNDECEGIKLHGSGAATDTFTTRDDVSTTIIGKGFIQWCIDGLKGVGLDTLMGLEMVPRLIYIMNKC